MECPKCHTRLPEGQASLQRPRNRLRQVEWPLPKVSPAAGTRESFEDPVSQGAGYY
jgi:hypothetical protein